MTITLGALGIIEDGAEGDNWYPECNALFRAITFFAGGAKVLDKDLTAPPGGEANGDAYIVGAGATGAWSTKDGKLARYSTHTAAYDFFDAREGMCVWVADEDLWYRHTGSAWVVASVQTATVSKTTTYTATANDGVILCDASGGAWSLTLPAAASSAGRVFFVKKTDSSANAVTIDGNASETIDGATTYVLSSQHQAVLIACNGSTWSVLASHGNQLTGASLSNNIRDVRVPFIIDGGGSVITTGLKGGFRVPAGSIVEATVLALDGLTGSIVIDLWKDTYANHPPTVADTITASAKPTISSGTKATDATLTGWTTSTAAGDIVFVNVDSASTFQRILLELVIRRS